MVTKALSRPLFCLAKHDLTFSRPASRSKANPRRHLSTSQHSCTSIPDFLLPASVTKEHHVSIVSYYHGPPFQSAPTNPRHPLQRRTFSASLGAKAAVVTANPRTDEDGNEMLIDITTRAAKVCLFHFSRPRHVMTANNGFSGLKRSCPRTPILILLYGSQSSLAGATAFNT